MRPVPLVVSDPVDVDARLAQLGLTAEHLYDAVLEGHLGRANCTAHDPPSFPGMTSWAVTTRGLRQQLIPEGWTSSDTGNYSTILSPDRSIAIVVATGDDATGDPHKGPKTKCAKGPATVGAVDRNQVQLDLFEPAPEPDVVVLKRHGANDPAEPMTWVLLIHGSPRGVRSELSLPVSIGADDRIEKWEERIILPPIGGDDGGVRRRTPEPGPDFDVDVVRRVG